MFEPSLHTFRHLIQTLRLTPPTSFAEQDLLNLYFKDKFKPLPIEYNLVLAFLWRHPDKVNLERVKVVHYYAAGSKPWRYTGREENMGRKDIKLLFDKWWEIYDDESLDLKVSQPPAGAIDVHVAADVSKKMNPVVMLSETRHGKYVTAPPAA